MHKHHHNCTVELLKKRAVREIGVGGTTVVERRIDDRSWYGVDGEKSKLFQEKN